MTFKAVRDEKGGVRLTGSWRQDGLEGNLLRGIVKWSVAV